MIPRMVFVGDDMFIFYVVPTELKRVDNIFYKHIVPTGLKTYISHIYKHIVPTKSTPNGFWHLSGLKCETVPIIMPIQKGF